MEQEGDIPTMMMVNNMQPDSRSDDETDTKDKPAQVEIQCRAISDDLVRDVFAGSLENMSKETVREIHKAAEDTVREQMFEMKYASSGKK